MEIGIQYTIIMLVLNAEPDIDLAVGITVQSHNVFQMPEFYDFWRKSPIDIKFITANILQTPKYLSPALWHGEYRTAIIKKLRDAESRHPEMDRFATYLENTEKTIRDYAKMRKYTRDIEARYVQDIKLKDMVKRYLKMPLENMDEVNERLENG